MNVPNRMSGVGPYLSNKKPTAGPRKKRKKISSDGIHEMVLLS